MAIKKSTPKYYPIKFIFQSLKKFVTMDLISTMKIGDLKDAFSNILERDFSSHNFIYYSNNQKIDPQKKISDFLSSTNYVPPNTFFEITIVLEECSNAMSL